jgi:hypothetical protein
MGVAMFLLGSMALLTTLPLPDPNTSDHPAIELIAALLVLGAGMDDAPACRRLTAPSTP